MSIASEITRLQTAKSDLATSITNKGVTVPASATLDDYSALVDSISGGGVNIHDEMSANMYVLTPNGTPYHTSYGDLFNFEYGKTYKIIVKCRTIVSSYYLFAYKGNASTPNVQILSLNNTNISETTYTHNNATTFTRMGIYTSDSSQRSSYYACAVYIKEI